MEDLPQGGRSCGNGPTGRVPCSVMTVRTTAPRSSRTRRMKTLTAWCTTDTLGALRPLDWATTGQCRVDHAVVRLERRRPTRVGFFVTTGLLTNMSCALRAVWARSRPVQAPALRDLCSFCSIGKNAGIHGSTGCDSCAPGRFEVSYGSSHCSKCGTGYFTAEESSSVCEICAAGRFEASNGSSHCPPCAEGYFSAEEGASVCDLCAAGYWSLSDGTACEACGPGHFAPWGAGSCQQCTAGQFSATNNSSTCVDCGIGRFANGSGMENCHGCHEVMSPGGANPQLWTTMREELRDGSVVLVYVAGAVTREECGCDTGAWMSLDSQCYECGDGVALQRNGQSHRDGGILRAQRQRWRCLDVSRDPKTLPWWRSRHVRRESG